MIPHVRLLFGWLVGLLVLRLGSLVFNKNWNLFITVMFIMSRRRYVYRRTVCYYFANKLWWIFCFALPLEFPRIYEKNVYGEIWAVATKKVHICEKYATFSAVYNPPFQLWSHIRIFRIMRPKTACICEKIHIFEMEMSTIVTIKWMHMQKW